MVWYTDGLSDATDAEGKYFGTRNILEVVQQHFDGSAREICDHLSRAVADFTQRDSLDDDLTVMVIKLKDDPNSLPFPPFSD
jgi:serine phosphatase RsbU (regulator of sigma subunit)